MLSYKLEYSNICFDTLLSLLCLGFLKTGSGKTYTMGTNYSGEGSNVGVIPKVMESIFKRVEVMKESTEFLIRVSFIEVKEILLVSLFRFVFLCLTT